jgi:glycerol-3-phosphate dehydrogenase
MRKNNKNPYFFPEEELSKNIELLENIEEILPSIDLIIIAIPNQFIKSLIKELKPYLKN